MLVGEFWKSGCTHDAACHYFFAEYIFMGVFSKSITTFQRMMIAILAIHLSGCAVVAVADAAVTVVATGVKVTAKAVGAVADVVIPDEDDE